MEKKRSKYEELKRYLMAFSLFCLCVAMAGMAATGARLFSITWWSFIVLVVLGMMGRVIIWAWSSSEQVKKGAYERPKPAE